MNTRKDCIPATLLKNPSFLEEEGEVEEAVVAEEVEETLHYFWEESKLSKVA